MELIEPFGVPDVFVSGVGEVEILDGGMLRITCYTEQRFAGRQENVVTAKLVIPAVAFPTAAITAIKGAGMPCKCRALNFLN